MSFQENNGLIELEINGTWDALKIKRCLDWLDDIPRSSIQGITVHVRRFPDNSVLCAFFLLGLSDWFNDLEVRVFTFEHFPPEYLGMKATLEALAQK